MWIVALSILIRVFVAVTHEAEYGTFTSSVVDRSAASNKKTVHLNQGEYIEWDFSVCLDSNSMSVINATITYTNDGGADILYLYLDNNYVGQITGHSMSNAGNLWNVPYDLHLIGPFSLSSSVTHSIKLVAQSTDTYGIEIDKISLTLTIASASIGQCYSNMNGISNLNLSPNINDLFIIESSSVITTCAEEDNILVYIKSNPKYNNRVHIDTINIFATYPKYFEHNPFNNRGADFTTCNFSNSNAPPGTETTTTLFDNGYLIIESVYVSNWWLNSYMEVSVNGGITSSNSAYWRVTQKLVNAQDDYQQTFVMYQDGNIRLLPHPPVCYGDWIPFGSSVIIGNTVSDIQENRPYSSIRKVIISPLNYKYITTEITFENGDTMSIALSIGEGFTQITANDINFSDTFGSLATFRSMYVTDNNNDVDSLRINEQYEYPIMQISNVLQGSVFEFGRLCISKHNTLSPDISFVMTGHLITLQPTINPSVTPSKTPTEFPTISPTKYPTLHPSFQPSFNPSIAPTQLPSCFYLVEEISGISGVSSTDFILHDLLRETVYNYTKYALLQIVEDGVTEDIDWNMKIISIGGHIDITFEICLNMQQFYDQFLWLVNNGLNFIGEYVANGVKQYFIYKYPIKIVSTFKLPIYIPNKVKLITNYYVKSNDYLTFALVSKDETLPHVLGSIVVESQ
eukprot:553523_1